MATEMMTVERLNELEALEKAATGGPWHREMLELARGGPMTLGIGAAERAVCIVNGIVESPAGNRDVALITVTRNALPALLAAARELLELKSAIVFDVRDTYTRRSIGMSDDAVFDKWRAGVVERGWQSPTAKGGNDEG